MEYVQERITTLHDLTGALPEAPTDRATVVVPMTHRQCENPAAERVLSTLSTVDPGSILVALRSPADRVAAVADWLEGVAPGHTLLWCNAPDVEALLADHGLDGPTGKGHDVWLALGVAATDAACIAVHDADAASYGPGHVPRLLAPLARGKRFSKGYYARVEDGRLYGRLCRLLYEPLVEALADRHDAEILAYLGAFRYALAGEFACTADFARKLRAQRAWGLEVGTLGDAYHLAGFEHTAQVDLGIHRHDHRAVEGPGGLSTMSHEVAAALFRAVEAGGVTPEYGTLPARYRDRASRFVDAYADDAAFNDLTYDPDAEREQVAAYAEAIGPPGEDDRLPAWDETALSAEAVARAATDAVSRLRGESAPAE